VLALRPIGSVPVLFNQKKKRTYGSRLSFHSRPKEEEEVEKINSDGELRKGEKSFPFSFF
jgi:hypothetical protein